VNSRAFKDRLYAEFAVLARALANPHRLELLDLLAQGERSVEDLAREANLSVTTPQPISRCSGAPGSWMPTSAALRGLPPADPQCLPSGALRECGSTSSIRCMAGQPISRTRPEAIDMAELLRRLTMRLSSCSMSGPNRTPGHIPTA
jgi:hypothetical protein